MMKRGLFGHMVWSKVEGLHLMMGFLLAESRGSTVHHMTWDRAHVHVFPLLTSSYEGASKTLSLSIIFGASLYPVNSSQWELKFNIRTLEDMQNYVQTRINLKNNKTE
jgi:hypothetical protein